MPMVKPFNNLPELQIEVDYSNPKLIANIQKYSFIA
jgi:hypothetical protein